MICKSRYIKAMEIGLAHERDGVSYFELVKQLEKELGYNFFYESEYTFLNWFIENFDFQQSNRKLDDIKAFIDWVLFTKYELDFENSNYDRDNQSPEIFKQIFFLKGQASKQYIDYQELQESRLAAVQSRKQSNYSIVIALGAILISSILGIATLIYQPENAQPPYNVKVIEDKTKTNELKKENKQLKEELFKAELKVKVLEQKLNN